jgi:hypothetical protein
MAPPSKASLKTKPVVSAVLLKMEVDKYEAARKKAAASGATLTGICRALFEAWLAAPSQPLPGLPSTPEDKPAT